MKAKKHGCRWFDPSRPLPDWDSDFWIGVLKNASSLLRRIEKANRKGNRRRARYLQHIYDNSLAPHAMALIFEHEFQEPTSPSAQSPDRGNCRR